MMTRERVKFTQEVCDLLKPHEKAEAAPAFCDFARCGRFGRIQWRYFES
jgi:hypothetical protein